MNPAELLRALLNRERRRPYLLRSLELGHIDLVRLVLKLVKPDLAMARWSFAPTRAPSAATAKHTA
jgi:hypothetical protein